MESCMTLDIRILWLISVSIDFLSCLRQSFIIFFQIIFQAAQNMSWIVNVVLVDPSL